MASIFPALPPRIFAHLFQNQHQGLGQSRKVYILLIVLQCQANIGYFKNVHQNGNTGEKEVAVGAVACRVRLKIVEEFSQSAAQQEVGHQIQGGRKQSDGCDHPQRWCPFQVVPSKKKITRIN